MNKIEDWEEDEKKLPPIQSDYEKKTQLSKIVEENSQLDDASCAKPGVSLSSASNVSS